MTAAAHVRETRAFSTPRLIPADKANPRWTTIKSIASALGTSLGELGEAVERRH